MKHRAEGMVVLHLVPGSLQNEPTYQDTTWSMHLPNLGSLISVLIVSICR